jgi:predicted NBD/HSP70 family sugar kinase
MDRVDQIGTTAGVNQQGLRDHNERLILSLLQRQGPIPGTDVARVAGLSPQTVSVILRSLEQDGLIERGDPQRGRVGKPAVPMSLSPQGVYSVGLKIGRRSADLVLVDFVGRALGLRQLTYRYPMPETVLAFLREGLAALTAGMGVAELARIAGIGIAMPWQIWNWHEAFGAPSADLEAWRGFDIAGGVAAFSALPVHVENDATAACRAENIFGRGRAFRDFAYIFVGSFIGGGLVLNHSVYDGRTGNAASFASLPAVDAEGRPCQLLDVASLYQLEAALHRSGQDPTALWRQPQDWGGFGAPLDDWIRTSAVQIARAAVTIAAVVDIEAVLIDGAFPADVRTRLVAAISRAMRDQDMRGVIEPKIEEGSVGGNARALGAASAPVFARYLLNTHNALSLA